MAISENPLKQLAEKVRRSFPTPAISSEFVKDHPDELPLFSAAEFKSALPAYLLQAISEWSPHSQVCEFTIYGVSPDKDFLESSFWPERYALFSRAQVEAILGFLELVAADEDFSFILSQVKRAPERILQLTEKAI